VHAYIENNGKAPQWKEKPHYDNNHFSVMYKSRKWERGKGTNRMTMVMLHFIVSFFFLDSLDTKIQFNCIQVQKLNNQM